MSALRVVSLSIIAATLAAAATVALAANDSEPVSRAEVRRQVLQARNDRQLARAGEAMQSFALAPTTGTASEQGACREERRQALVKSVTRSERHAHSAARAAFPTLTLPTASRSTA